MILRPAAAPDSLHIAKILVEARTRFMPYAPSAHAPADVANWVRQTLVPGGGVTVAERRGEVVGLVAVATRDGWLWIDQMFVRPESVGLGVGSHLLSHVAPAPGPAVRLYTFQANVGARRFYERHGFVAVRFTDGLANEEKCPDVLYERRCQPASTRPA